MQDNNVILTFVLVAIAVVSALVSLGVYRDARRSFQILLEGVERDEVKTVLHDQFGRLDPEIQANILKLISVADPLTALSPTDLDDRVMEWLKEITSKN